MMRLAGELLEVVDSLCYFWSYTATNGGIWDVVKQARSKRFGPQKCQPKSKRVSQRNRAVPLSTEMYVCIMD